ncbi:succinylglutamate desuccinylase/aspartoacylase family protein [Sulfurospirillum arcachonense]|uniref:succinylglutamate desuccinylase/aspartoacylase family protein n=1 Tax=Sulfurospirillum arcachonense TaxID=57666 RepID=UPI00046AE33F|nr:succinylglutamate desuccinylase/aspartoacylase family protein [Sulfurospirillum arcachonense]
MSNDILTIGKYEIKRGTSNTIELDLPNLYNTPTKLPIKVLRGKKDGPTVFVSATIHGDELNGIEIIRRFKKLSILKRLKGTIILVPVINVYGILTLSRYFPDRRDLNRCFPGSTRGSLASRVAKIFFDEIVSKCDFGIDLHTAAIHRSNFPQIRTNLNNKVTLKMAKVFEAPIILHSELLQGSLRALCDEKGIPIILYEAGEALRFDEKSIRIGVNGIVNVLREYNMLPKVFKKSKRIPLITSNSQWIRAVESGVIRTIKALGDTVQEDEVIAYIDEAHSDTTFELKSPFDGVIIGKSEIPLAQEGDAIFHIAKFNDLENAEGKIGYFHEDVIEQSEFDELQDEKTIE